jgi:hypothetical protein
MKNRTNGVADLLIFGAWSIVLLSGILSVAALCVHL